jgi:hypothetical protein
LVANLAIGLGELPVKVDNFGAAGALVQIIDVLCDQGKGRHMARDGRDRSVPGIGLRRKYERSAPFVPAPHQGGVAVERVRRRELGRVEVLPETGLFVAKRRNAAFCRYSGAREYHHACCRT